ncbi:MAG: VCBS repeat-containing protein [Acidobacteria bacterium]|nr:VCBS repeat-containing protein [Acidobacteriota bacterium]
MKLKTRWIFIVLAATLAAGAYLFLRAPLQLHSIAKSPDEGVVLPGTNGKARSYPNGVIKVEPENFAVTTALRDLPDAKDSKEPYVSVEERIEEQRIERIQKERIAKGLPRLSEEDLEKLEINEQNRERVKKVLPGAGAGDGEFSDPLLRKDADLNAPSAMPTPSLTFDGAGMADNAAAGGGTGFTPPDVNGDVGPNHYVSSINVVLKVFNKNGTLAAAAKKTSDLFASLPAADPCRTRNDGDPVVVYDSLADRWVITQFSIPGLSSGSGNNYECVAVSTTSDPTGTYYVWSYLYPGGIGNDYPKIGVWTDAYHMTFNQFNNAGTTFLGMGFLSQDRTKALVGDPTTSVIYKNIAPIDPNAGGGLPADIDGLVPPPAGLSEVIAEFRSDEFGDPLDAIRYYKWVPDFTTPGNTTLTVLPDVALAPFDARSPTSTSSVMEVSGGATLDGLNDRLMHRFAYRNLGSFASPTNSYTGNFTVNISGVNPTTAGTYQGGIRWFEMRRNADAFAVNDQGTHSTGAVSGSTGLNNWMGSVAQDNQGNIALGFSQSSTTQRADIKIAGRTGAPSGTLNEGEALMFASPAVQTSSNRWGDYSSMTVDPTDDCTFWYTQEYYAANSSSNFSTRVGSFKFPGCAPAQKGTINGTITSCSTGLPISAASVAATGGYNRLTIANGTYSMTVAPGSYTVSASKTGGFSGNSQNTSVTNGGTSTVNVCLNAVPQIAGGSPSIVAEACGLPNNAPDPGELLTVRLPLSNTGAADTANLVATLQSTGGVVAGSAQNYGVVTAGGAAVSRDFAFTVNPGAPCGSSITLTWVITDGAANLGTVTKSYGTGASVVNLDQKFDGVTAPALPAGWTQNQTSGTAINWVTSTTSPNSAPNTAFANDPATVNATALESPVFAVSVANAGLTFQKAFTTENTFDGVVLEIKVGAGAWQDIVTAGGVFVSGGYNGTISTGFSSPIGGRQAWTGTSATYSQTQVTLPASANGQNVQLRWLMASDSSVASTGFRLDDVQVTGGVLCNTCAASVKSRGDFDGDGKTDLSVFRASESNWYLNRSTAGFTVVNFGVSSDTLTPADWDGDGKADVAVFRPTPTSGTPDFWILRSSDSTLAGAEWGTTGDTAQVGDYDGDGKADPAVFRAATNTWFIVNSGGGSTAVPFGSAGDIPVRADYNGDGKTDIAIFRPASNQWWISNSGGGVTAQTFGAAGDKLVPADYDGDNKDDIAIWRPSTGQWWVIASSTGTPSATTFGISTDIPVPGDYDGDGKDDLAIYRAGQWWLNRSTAGVAAINFGIASDTPIPTRYIP